MTTDVSGIKIFDRKFIAVHLVPLLKCKKCGNEFTDRHQKEGDDPGHRPILLKCGHNMCENCVVKHRHSLQCAICSAPAPPTINTKGLKTTAKFHARDYYEINYYVIGMANSIKFFSRFTQDVVNKSLICISDYDFVVQSKCSECNGVYNVGRCIQCNANFCKRCFEPVHSLGKIFKSHQFEALNDKNSSKNKAICVGNELFQMPKVNNCYNHRRPKSVYCTTCRSPNCDKCHKFFHANHKSVTLASMNMRYMDEIPSTINSIDAQLEMIRNAQEAVKNSKKQLNDYAVETISDMSEYFQHLHGMLQLAELRGIEMMREQSLPTQIKLNEKMSELEGYETVLQRMRQILVCSKGDRMEVPKDLWLKEVLRLSHQHLEKMPSDINITKLMSNPFCFTHNDENRAKLLESLFQYKFIDPKMKVKLHYIFDENNSDLNATNHDVSEISVDDASFTPERTSNKDSDDLSSPQRLDRKKHKRYQTYTTNPPTAKMLPHRRQQVDLSSASQQVSKIGRRLLSISNASKPMDNASFESESFTFEPQQEEEFLRSFGTMDISKRSECLQLASSITDWFKSDILVKVLNIQSPEDFYVQGVNYAKHLGDMLNSYIEECRPTCQPSSIVIGQHYLILTDYNNCQRALVRKKMDKLNKCCVFLPDLGVHAKVNHSNFRGMPNHLAKLPYAAVLCKLKQLMPPNGESTWSHKAAGFMKQLLKNNAAHVSVMVTTSGNKHEIDLITANDNISIRQSFLYTGFARTRERLPAATAQYAHIQQERSALPSQRLPKEDFQRGNVIAIQMLHIKQPTEFYIMRHDLELTRINLMEKLNYTMDECSLSELEIIFLGRLQMACTVQLNNQWHRACIEKMLPEGNVVIRLVDWGALHKLNWNQLFVLPKEFYNIPEIANKCALADVETLQHFGYIWTEAASCEFQQLTSNPNLSMEFLAKRDDTLHVALSVPQANGETCNVAAALVEKGHCSSSGPSSKKPVILSKPNCLDEDTREFIKQNMAAALTSKNPAKTQEDRMKRVNVVVTSVRNPSEFYMALMKLYMGVEELKKKAHKAAINIAEKYIFDSSHKWQKDENCYINVAERMHQESRWYRGTIKSVKPTATETRYDVFLRDTGHLMKGVLGNCLINIDEHHNSMADSVQRCQLYGLSPNNAEKRWAQNAVDFFNAQTAAFDRLWLTAHGRTKNDIKITLWGEHVEIDGPFSPACIKYVNINETLVMAGWAVQDQRISYENLLDFDSLPQLDLEEQENNEAIVQQCIETVDNALATQKVRETLEQSAHDPVAFAPTPDMPDLKLLDELNAAIPTTSKTQVPAAWQKPRPLKKSIFTANPTYVNNECEIYLSLTSDEPYIKEMRRRLDKTFRPLMKDNQKAKYIAGQPVVVKYHLDASLCRGRITKQVTNMAYEVYFIDYGNVEIVDSESLLPFAPFPHLHAMTARVLIHGIKPKKDKYSIKVLDTVHFRLVSQLTSVRLIDKTANGLPRCQFKVNDTDIAVLMEDNHMADVEKMLPVEASNQQNSFGMDRNDSSTTKPPTPKKKKFTYNAHEVSVLDNAKDIDCHKDAMESTRDNCNYANDSENGFKNENANRDLIDMDENLRRLDTIEHMDKNNEPFLHRICLRHKDMTETVHFDPLDCSTTRSFYDGIDCFKEQSIPFGVKQFHCTIDSVISGTELQISPCLSELTRQNLNLVQAISSCIDKAARLETIVPKVLCLARYAQDQLWYRAMVKELHPNRQEVTVFYIDFHDTELVPYENIKEMPEELFMYPLRSFRVKLHGVKANPKYDKKSVRQALQVCLCKQQVVFARLHYPSNYYNTLDKSVDEIVEDFNQLDKSVDERMDSRSSASGCNGNKNRDNVIEVDLYENANKTERLLYQPLLDGLLLLRN